MNVAARAFALLALAFGLAACASGPRPPLNATAVALVDGTGERYCGAVAIGTQTLLTAGHCVTGRRGADRIAYVTEERWTTTARGVYWATPLRSDMERDIAWLRAEGPAMVPARVGVPIGPVYAVGPAYDWAVARGPLGLRYPLRFDGDTFTATDYGVEYWTAALSIAPGWSGSPVFAEDGALVGVLSACVRTGPGVCRTDYAIFSPVYRPALTGPASQARLLR